MIRRGVFFQLYFVLSLGLILWENESYSATFAKPTVDVAFRHLLGDEAIAASLINGILEDVSLGFRVEKVEKIQRVEEKISLSPKRSAFMDFHVRINGQADVIIEMQVQRHAMFDERALYYAAYTYSHQLTDEEIKQENWYRYIKPLYAIQLLDYETNPVRVLKRGKMSDPLDEPFVQMVSEHPMPEGSFAKHYVMYDQASQQAIARGIHLIQIELPRASRIRELDPNREGFYERAKKFSLSDWWYFIFKYIDKINPDQLDNFASDTDMPDVIKEAFERLRKQMWGSDLKNKYEEEETSDVRQKYSTALAVEREEGLQEGRKEGIILGGLIGEFVLTGKLGPKSLQRIKRNPPGEPLIRAIWNEREAEMAELESDEGEEEDPEGRTFNDFIVYLRAEGVIRKEEGE
jgi:hypothetical protein